jgi:hypothetical protein
MSYSENFDNDPNPDFKYLRFDTLNEAQNRGRQETGEHWYDAPLYYINEKFYLDVTYMTLTPEEEGNTLSDITI